MSHDRDISMNIYGEITDVAAIEALAHEMVDYVQPGHHEGTFEDVRQAISYIVEMIEGGHSLYVMREDANLDLVNLTKVCQEYGLAYEIQQDAVGDMDATVRTWAPGFDGERRPDVDPDFRPYSSHGEIESLVGQGMKSARAKLDASGRDQFTRAEVEALLSLAVGSLQAKVDASKQDMLEGIEKTIRTTPEVLAELKEYLAEESAPAL